MKHLVLIFISTLVLNCQFGSALTKKRVHSGIGHPWIENLVTLPPDEWFDQKLDHFDPTSNATWKQRYGTNDTFFKPGTDSPVFLMIGGEGEATPKWLVTGMWITYAESYGALCFQLEHRYYGKSHPTEDLSTENLKYLSSEQALADLAYFIEGMNKKYNLTSSNKWITFGGSYPGSLSAWVRMKYPHLVHAAVSTSGPLLAEADFSGYNEVVRASLNTYGKNCSKAVHDANVQLETLLKHPRGRTTIYQEFKLCKKLNPRNKKDLATLFETLSDMIARVVQYNKDNRGSDPYKVTIDTICDVLTNETLGTPIQRYAALSKQLNLQNSECLDYSYSEMVKELQSTKYDTTEDGRQWIYQTCTEFGFYQTSEKPSSLFGPTFNLKYFEDLCTDVYGPNFNKKSLDSLIYRTNVLYGALNIKVSRVVFVHGSIDPWHALGIIKSSDPNAPAIYIKGTAHCANMYPPSSRDLPQLVDARVKISGLIGDWLKE